VAAQRAARRQRVVEHDYLVLGAGPGGLQLGYFLQRSGCDYLLLESGRGVGSFFRTYPRRRRLISFNKRQSLYRDPEIRLRWDWNSLLTDDYSLPFADFSRELYPHADDLVRYLEHFARRAGLAIAHGVTIVRIARRRGGGFLLQDARGRAYRCRVLVLATGFSRPYVPAIPGIEHGIGYEAAPVKPSAYEGQRLLIVGKGNSALEIADVALGSAALIHVASPTPIQLAWKTRHAGHLRAEHTRLLDMYQLKTLHGALDCHVTSIRKLPRGRFGVTVRYVHADGEVEQLVYDRVIRCTGFRMDTSVFTRGCRPDTVLDGRLPAIAGMWESTNVPDLYFAGTLMQALDFKRSSSAFIDGFRYNVRTLHRHLMQRYEGRPFPVTGVPADPAALRRHVLARACRSSGLWTQFGYLCDLLVLDRAGGRVLCTEDLPLHHVEQTLGEHALCFTLSFHWGTWSGDVFDIQRHPSAAGAHTNVFLHPVVRCYRRGRRAGEHHVLEDLFGTYTAAGESGIVTRRSGRDMQRYHREEHEEPLQRFLAKRLGRN